MARVASPFRQMKGGMTRAAVKHTPSHYTKMSTSFPYSAVNPYDLFFSVLRHRDEGKENQFHFVEMSEREGSFSMTDRIDERRIECHWQQIGNTRCGEWSGRRTGTHGSIH